jgi:hypothetical protein
VSNVRGLKLDVDLADKTSVAIEATSCIPQTIALHAVRLSNELKHICKQYAESNWDGYGAQPISEKACNDAERFVQMLPPHVISPEITPIPDGDIALEWYGKEKTLFFVTFHGDNMAEYIGSFGEGEKASSRESIEKALPHILRYIERIISTLR